MSIWWCSLNLINLSRFGMGIYRLWELFTLIVKSFLWKKKHKKEKYTTILICSYVQLFDKHVVMYNLNDIANYFTFLVIIWPARCLVQRPFSLNNNYIYITFTLTSHVRERILFPIEKAKAEQYMLIALKIFLKTKKGSSIKLPQHHGEW